MSSNILKQELKNRVVRNVYLLYGEEDYLKKFYAKKIEEIVLEKDFGDINRFVIEEPKDVSKIEDLCETLPCFADKKFILVRNSSFFKSTKKEAKLKKEKLEKLIEILPEYVCLVFVEIEIDKRLKAVKAIEKKGLTVEFGIQGDTVLLKWVEKEMKKYGKIVHPSVAIKIIQYCDSCMEQICTEMEKLRLYVDDREEITDLDVENVCIKSVNVRIFDLIDNISLGRSDLALKNFRDMLILKEPVPKIMYMIIRHVVKLLDMKMLFEEGLGVKDCVSIMKIAPYAANKMAGQIKNFDVRTLKRALKGMLELDQKIKIGEIKDVLAVEVSIVKLCSLV